MRLRRFEVKNFKAIEDIATDWEELLVLIGENNCGKSSLLLALSWFLSGSGIRDELLFHKYETGPLNAIELVGYFSQLTDAEKMEVAVQGRMNGDEWILKKKFWFERGVPGDSEKGDGKRHCFRFLRGKSSSAGRILTLAGPRFRPSTSH